MIDLNIFTALKGTDFGLTLKYSPPDQRNTYRHLACPNLYIPNGKYHPTALWLAPSKRLENQAYLRASSSASAR